MTHPPSADPIASLPPAAALAMLQWYVDIGITSLSHPEPAGWDTHRPTALPVPTAPPAAAGSAPVIAPQSTGAPSAQTPLGTAEAVVAARALAASARTLDELKEKLRSFDGLSIVRTAHNLVFADGVAGARLMVIGEAPGREEDEQGKPFVGQSGKLLDRMLAAIGHDRRNTYISNILNWRPPGNRKPNPGEMEICKPFIARHIELAAPVAILLLGDTAGKALLPVSQGITRYRGRWFDYRPADSADPIPCMASFHPAFLLRTPARKREAWLDLLEIADKLATDPS